MTGSDVRRHDAVDAGTGRPAPGGPATGACNRRTLLLGSIGGLAAVALAACGDGAPATGAPAIPTPAVAGGTVGLGIVGLIVQDLPRSLEFYRRLGLAVPQDVDTTRGAVRLRMPNDTIFVWETVEYTQAGFDSTYEPTGLGNEDRKITLEFGFRSADEVTAKYEEMIAAGAPSFQEPVSWSGGKIRFAMIVDPDENRIGLRWPYAS